MEIQYNELDRENSEWLGSGGFGRVFEATWKNKRVACKILKHAIHPSIFYKEIDIMKRLGSNLHIVSLLGFVHDITKDEFMCIVMERASGIPLSCAIMYHDMTDATRRKISIDIIDTLSYIHHHDIIYRDLKPDNIIINLVDSSIQLIDFGSAIVCTKDQMIKGIVGTPGYMAPEVCQNIPYHHPIDIYSYGMTLFVLWTQHEPCRLSRIDRIMKCYPPISPLYRDIIMTCLRSSSYERPSARSIIETLEELCIPTKRTWLSFFLNC